MYLLEPGSANVHPQSMFSEKKKKKNYHVLFKISTDFFQ